MDADESGLNLSDAIGLNGLLAADAMGTAMVNVSLVVYGLAAGGSAVHSGGKRGWDDQSRAKDEDEAYTK